MIWLWILIKNLSNDSYIKINWMCLLLFLATTYFSFCWLILSVKMAKKPIYWIKPCFTRFFGKTWQIPLQFSFDKIFIACFVSWISMVCTQPFYWKWCRSCLVKKSRFPWWFPWWNNLFLITVFLSTRFLDW